MADTSAEFNQGLVLGLAMQPMPVSTIISGTGTLYDYEYISDNSVRYNNITYTVETDEETGLINKVTDSYNREYKPTINSGITNPAVQNAVFWAAALLSGLGEVHERVLYNGLDGSWEFSGGLTGFTTIKNSAQDKSGQDYVTYTTGEKVIRLSKSYRLTDAEDNYTDAIVVRTNEKLNLTGYSKIRILALAYKNYSSLAGNVYICSGEPAAAQTKTAYSFGGWGYICSCNVYSSNYTNPGTPQWYEIDINALSGNQYLNFGLYHGTETTACTVYFDIQKIILIP